MEDDPALSMQRNSAQQIVMDHSEQSAPNSSSQLEPSSVERQQLLRQNSKVTKQKYDFARGFLYPAVGMLVFHVCHGAVQEKVFLHPGYKFGWFMTLIENVTVVILSSSYESIQFETPGGWLTFINIAIVGVCVSISHGAGNTALRYSTYPLKVAFRSCKLVPTMLLGMFLTGRRYSTFQYFAAFLMCGGMVLLTTADSEAHAEADHREVLPLGPLLLLISTTLDAIIPNIQERLLQQVQVRPVDLVFYSNLVVFFIVVIITSYTGEIAEAILFCWGSPYLFWLLIVQSLCAYMGLRFYLIIIRNHGGVAGVLLGNARKIITIVLSFVMFSKPCSLSEMGGLSLIFIGMYMAVSKYRLESDIQKPPLSENEEEDV